jgi:IS30 family transposase
MRPILSAQRENILSLASHGHSTCTIAFRLTLSQSTVSRTLRTLHPRQPLLSGGHPSKLSSISQRAILSQITTGKAANAVQATHYINTIIPNPVFSETVRRVLKKNSFKAVVKKKKPLLSARHRRKRLAFALKYREWTVED